MISLEVLNGRLSLALGRPNGVDGRFKWINARDLPYFFRNQPHEAWQRRSWADRIGPCWVLCQWRPPETTIAGITCELTREQWHQMFGASRPYPEKGQYQPFAETALKVGMLPDEEMTAFYIRAISQQLDQAEADNKEQRMGREGAVAEMCEKEAQAVVDQHENEFMESVADWEPLSWKLGEPRDSGDKDGPVSFEAGVGDSPVSSKVGA